MPWSPDSSITGGAQTGFTSPTYTLADDVAPATNAKQKVVSTLGGTQTGATANSVSNPFTITFSKPAVLKVLPAANPITGLRGNIPVNQYKIVIRKGGNSASGVPCTAIFRGTWDIPAGMDSYSPAELQALNSLLVGLLNEESADLSDTMITGTI